MESRVNNSIKGMHLTWRCELKIASAEGGLCQPRAWTSDPLLWANYFFTVLSALPRPLYNLDRQISACKVGFIRLLFS